MADKDEKTEQPTGRRKEDARKKGDIARSKDMTASMGLFLTIIFFALYTPHMGNVFLTAYKKYFSRAAEIVVTQSSFDYVLKDVFWIYLKLMLPLFVLLIAVAVLVELVQAGGFRIVTENLKIKWEKVFIFGEFMKGLKKVLGSLEALFDLFKSIVKVIAIGLIAYYTLRSDVPDILGLPMTSLGNIMSYMGKIFLKLSFNIVLFLLIISVLDIVWQKYRYNEKLKMSKQEVKDEYKQLEGDPEIKGKQKQIQYQRAMQRMMAEVPQADVVITNPTHYAVALKYEYKNAFPEIGGQRERLNRLAD